MKNVLDSKNEFSLIRRAMSVVHAARGIYIFLKTTPNAWIQFCVSLFAIGLGYYFKIEKVEWLFLILSIGFVFASEAFNTAIEIDINLTSPEYHPYARDTKDVAAGAVLISVVTALVMGVIIFVPYIFYA
jgi:diacylglycerol kinase